MTAKDVFLPLFLFLELPIMYLLLFLWKYEKRVGLGSIHGLSVDKQKQNIKGDVNLSVRSCLGTEIGVFHSISKSYVSNSDFRLHGKFPDFEFDSVSIRPKAG